MKIELVNTKKLYDEEARKEKERLALSYQWEVERRLREAQVLRELEESRRQAKIEEMNRFRKQLDLQRVSSTTKINELILRHFIYPPKYIDNNLYLIIVIHSRATYIGKNVICSDKKLTVPSVFRRRGLMWILLTLERLNLQLKYTNLYLFIF